jgi:N-acetylglucosamine-6-phosphate deacetylase
MRTALTAARLHDGTALREGHAVLVEGADVLDVLPRGKVPDDVPLTDLGSGTLVPGFVDLQVNGGGGVLLNERPDADGVRAIAAAHRAFGTTALLPTVITDAPEVMRAAAEGVRRARQEGVPGVIGLHVEGPFIDLSRKGAHPPGRIRALSEEDLAWLASLACGAVLLTLSPALVPPGTVRQLVDAGIVVSLGHSDATEEQVRAALDAGASGFTHLFNAMSQLGHRTPGMVGAALADRSSFVGLIADGHHVADTALRVALAAKPHDRIVLVSDAMPPAAGGPDVFHLQGRPATRSGGSLRLADGTLAGSVLTMDEALRYVVHRLGVSLEQAVPMTGLNPARWIGQEARHGRLAPGAAASLVHLSHDLTVKGVWAAGAKV